MSRTVRMLVELEVTVLDESWTDRDLIDNMPDYLESMIHEAEESNRARFPDESAYEINRGSACLWTYEGFFADLRDLAVAKLSNPDGVGLVPLEEHK